jgi:hypothetical protein
LVFPFRLYVPPNPPARDVRSVAGATFAQSKRTLNFASCFGAVAVAVPTATTPAVHASSAPTPNFILTAETPFVFFE